MPRGGRRGGGRGGPLGMVFKGIGSGVGMATEYNQHRKDMKAAGQPPVDPMSLNPGQTAPRRRSAEPSPQPGSSSYQDAPPSYDDAAGPSSRGYSSADERSYSRDVKDGKYEDDGYYDEDDYYDDETTEDEDEETWALDEAIDRKPSASEKNKGESNDQLIREILSSAPPRSADRGPLPMPIIIPQRRPGALDRGFVRAYPPLVGEMKGIDQETFVKFLTNFWKSAQASSVFGVVQLAAGITGMVPELTIAIASGVVQTAAMVGEKAQNRYRTNNFLDRMNDEFFKPMGMYAMIVKYKQGDDSDPISMQAVDLNTNEAIAKYAKDPTASGLSAKFKNMRMSSAQTEGWWSIPASAPLVYPEVDKQLEKGPEGFKANIKDFAVFMATYQDKMASRKFAQADPNSALRVPDEQYAMKSAHADPNHPMYHNGLVGLLTGGKMGRNRPGEQGQQGDYYNNDRGFDDRGGYGGSYDQGYGGGYGGGGYGPSDYDRGYEEGRRRSSRGGRGLPVVGAIAGRGRGRRDRGRYDDDGYYGGRDGGRRRRGRGLPIIGLLRGGGRGGGRSGRDSRDDYYDDQYANSLDYQRNGGYGAGSYPPGPGYPPPNAGGYGGYPPPQGGDPRIAADAANAAYPPPGGPPPGRDPYGYPSDQKMGYGGYPAQGGYPPPPQGGAYPPPGADRGMPPPGMGADRGMPPPQGGYPQGGNGGYDGYGGESSQQRKRRGGPLSFLPIGGGRGGRKIQANVLYLMIINRPSQEEIDEAKAILQQQKEQK